MHNPLEQFQIKTLLPIEVLGHNLGFTNSSFLMAISIAVLSLFYIAIRHTRIVPTRVQAAAEMLYNMVDQMIEGTIGQTGKKYMPAIFSIFIFISFANLLGMIPYSFTTTSHIAITFTLAISVFIWFTAIGFKNHGLHYFHLLLPEGTPIVMAPLIILIELFAYLVRPVSLAIRLAANMTAGHIVLKVLASFVIMARFLGFLPFALLTILVGFEIFVAVLQAYIFTILTCAYLNDAVNMH